MSQLVRAFASLPRLASLNIFWLDGGFAGVADQLSAISSTCLTSLHLTSCGIKDEAAIRYGRVLVLACPAADFFGLTLWLLSSCRHNARAPDSGIALLACVCIYCLQHHPGPQPEGSARPRPGRRDLHHRRHHGRGGQAPHSTHPPSGGQGCHTRWQAGGDESPAWHQDYVRERGGVWRLACHVGSATGCRSSSVELTCIKCAGISIAVRFVQCNECVLLMRMARGCASVC